LCPIRNLPLAMQHITQAETQFIRILNDNKSYREASRLIRQHVNLTMLRNKRQQIAQMAQTDVNSNSQMTSAEIEHYADAFSTDPLIGKTLRKQRLHRNYERAKQLGTVEAYYTFVENYMGTSEADSAEAAIAMRASQLFDHVDNQQEVDQIANRYKNSESVQRQATQHKSKLAFAEALNKHTIAAYREFMKDHPSSDEYLTAIQKMDDLIQIEYATLKTPSDYIQFIKKNNDSELAEEALDRLCQLIVKEKNIEAAKSYLQNFPLDIHYDQIFRLYYDWHAAEGNLQPIQAFAENEKNYPFQRVLQADMLEALQIDSLNLMKPFNDQMLNEYVSFIRFHTGKRIAFVALQRILQPLCAKEQWNNAIERMGSVCLSFDNDESRSKYQDLRQLLENPSDKRSTIEYLPSHNVMHPVMHPDGKHLYYTHADNKTSQIWVAQRSTRSSRWENANPIRFSNADNNGMTIFSFYDNGQRMLLGKDGDILIAVYEDNLWRISDLPPYPVNSDSYDGDAYMAPDGSGMLIASDRAGGYNLQKSGAYYHGDTALATDIYFVPMTIDGWGTPINLGSQINTTCCEQSPVLSQDLKTLYFVSDGHGGMGYGDILMATRTNPTDWTSWSTPKNLGKTVNSTFAETSISLTYQEDQLLIASNRQNNRYGCYATPTQHETTDFTSRVSINALHIGNALTHLEIADMSVQSICQQIDYPNANTIIPLTLYQEKQYILYPTVIDRFTPAILIDPKTDNHVTIQAYTEEELLQRRAIVLPAVAWDLQSTKLMPLSLPQIEQLAYYLNQHPKMHIELIVNTPGRNAKDCYELSIQRAQSMRRMLVSLGVPLEKITTSPYGNANYGNATAPEGEMIVRFSDY
ncbi:MAG: hypothetical protein KBT04_02735, partial [Bacteroidales bacterium]|nr:hypothetical protein [Candidatus Colimorpha onthohippi]